MRQIQKFCILIRMKKWLGLFIFFCSFPLLAKQTVYIVEIGGIQTDKYFYDAYYYRDEVSKPYVMMREALEQAGYNVKFTNDCSNLRDVAAVISFSDATREIMPRLQMQPKHKRLLFIFEPPVVLPYLYDFKTAIQFGKVFTMFDDQVGPPNYYKLYFPMPRLSIIDGIPDFAQKKFCTMINGNKDSNHPKSLYGERRKAISFFTEKGDFDLYGPNWEGYTAWKGSPKMKWAVLKDYKFCICYENMKDQLGYITEKIFDCLIGGCVPIYWGASNIAEYVSKEAWIDRRDFATDEDLYVFLQSIDRKTYEAYLSAAKEYLASPGAQRFSSERFVETVLKAVKTASQ